MDEGRLPEDWKKAKVTPIHKKGSKKLAGNYRLISLTSQVCKVLERIVREHLTNHLDEHNLITPRQHGFVKNKSCQTNLLETMEDWTRALDNGSNLDVIYLDYQKAFDTVPHRRLIEKLRAYGVQGKLLDWIKSFLTGRSQQVIVGNRSWTWGSVPSGSPKDRYWGQFCSSFM